MPKYPKFAIFSVKISFLTNKNKIFGISVLFYTGKSKIKSLLYFQFIFIERAVNTLVVLILNQMNLTIFAGTRVLNIYGKINKGSTALLITSYTQLKRIFKFDQIFRKEYNLLYIRL